MTRLIERALRPRVTRWAIHRIAGRRKVLLAAFPAGDPHETPEEAVKRYLVLFPESPVDWTIRAERAR